MSAAHFVRFPMKKGEVIKLAQPKGCTIKADSGQLWITQTNIKDDVFLAPGEVYTARQNGLLVAEAMTNSLMSMNYAKRKPANESRRVFVPNLVAVGAAS